MEAITQTRAETITAETAGDAWTWDAEAEAWQAVCPITGDLWTAEDGGDPRRVGVKS